MDALSSARPQAETGLSQGLPLVVLNILRFWFDEGKSTFAYYLRCNLMFYS